MTTKSRVKPPTWRAGADRLAHATGPRETRTLCGATPVLERLAWPAERRCVVCAAIAEGQAR